MHPALAYAGNPTQNPSTIASSGLAAWLRTDLGLPGGQADNATMATWASQVAGGADCAQTTDAKRPVWHSSGGLNGLPYLTFNGSKAFTWALDHGGTRTIFCVFRITTAPGSSSFYTLYSPKRTSDSTFTEYLDMNLSGYKNTSFRADYQGAGVGAGYDVTLGTTNGHCSIFTYNGGTNTSTGSYTDTLDGTSQTMAVSSVVARTSTDLGSVGGRLNSAETVSNGALMDLYELADWTRVLNSTEISQLASYSRTRYGTP